MARANARTESRSLTAMSANDVAVPRPAGVAETPRLMAALFGLTFATGVVDAASVLGLGHVFTANMTGNVVFIGFALGGRDETAVGLGLVSLAAFLFGAMVGGRITPVATRRVARRALSAALVALALATAVSFVPGAHAWSSSGCSRWRWGCERRSFESWACWT